MWSDVAEIAVEVLAPGGGSDTDYDRLFDKKNQLRVPLAISGAFKERLAASGWFAEEEVLAAGIVTQGNALSLTSMLTGWALVELARAKRSKSLPRELCLVVTEDRVIALAMSSWSEGSDDGGSDVVVKVKREEAGSWPRREVRIEPDGRKLRSGQRGGTLELAGAERFPVNWALDSDAEELVVLLAR